MTLYRNPLTLGKTPTVEAYRIGLCPTCAWPVVSLTEAFTRRGRKIKCHCGQGHPWVTTWPGGTRQIRRQTYRGGG